MIKVFLIPIEEPVARLDAPKENVIIAYEIGKNGIEIMHLDAFENGFNRDCLPYNLEDYNVRFIEYDRENKNKTLSV